MVVCYRKQASTDSCIDEAVGSCVSTQFIQYDIEIKGSVKRDLEYDFMCNLLLLTQAKYFYTINLF